MSVFPVPPLGPSTQIIGDSATPVATAAPCFRAIAFCKANRTSSGDSGSATMSSAPDSKTRRTKPFGDSDERTTTGRSGRCLTAPSMKKSARSE
jgi:hypothetical protein